MFIKNAKAHTIATNSKMEKQKIIFEIIIDNNNTYWFFLDDIIENLEFICDDVTTILFQDIKFPNSTSQHQHHHYQHQHQQQCDEIQDIVIDLKKIYWIFIDTTTTKMSFELNDEKWKKYHNKNFISLNGLNKLLIENKILINSSSSSFAIRKYVLNLMYMFCDFTISQMFFHFKYHALELINYEIYLKFEDILESLKFQLKKNDILLTFDRDGIIVLDNFYYNDNNCISGTFINSKNLNSFNNLLKNEFNLLWYPTNCFNDMLLWINNSV